MGSKLINKLARIYFAGKRGSAMASEQRAEGWYWSTYRDAPGPPFPLKWQEGEEDLFCIRGPRIPEPAELAALIALRDGIDADFLDHISERSCILPGKAEQLRMIAVLRRAATPESAQGAEGGESNG